MYHVTEAEVTKGMIRGRLSIHAQRDQPHTLHHAAALAQVDHERQADCAKPDIQPQETKFARTSCAECVAGCELPHASEELGEASNPESHSNNNIGVSNATDASVVERQDERGRRE